MNYRPTSASRAKLFGTLAIAGVVMIVVGGLGSVGHR